MYKKEHVTITASGELSQLEQDIILRYLGRQGLNTEVSVQAAPEQEPVLGYASYENILDFFRTSGQFSSSGSFNTTFWNNMIRISHANDPRAYPVPSYTAEVRGKIQLDSQWVELFKISPSAESFGSVGGSSGKTATGYGLNLDTLELLVDNGVIQTLDRAGMKTEEFARALLEHRKLQNEQAE